MAHGNQKALSFFLCTPRLHVFLWLAIASRLMTIPDGEDCRLKSPVFYGYDLVKKPRSRAGALPEDEVPQREDFVTHRKGKPCPVCLVGKPGTTVH